MTAPLEALLADRGARARRRQAVRAFADGWLDRPVLTGLRNRVGAIDAAQADAATAVLDAARPLLEETAWIAEGLAELARLARADPLFEPPLRPIATARQKGLQLFHHPLLSISVLTLEGDAGPGPSRIGFPGHASLVRFLRGRGGRIDLWRLESDDGGFSAAGAGRCRPAGSIAIDEAAILAFDGARETWTLAATERDPVIVQATARIGAAPLRREYEAAGGALLEASATDAAAVRMQLMASLLRTMGRADAASALADVAREGPFHMRWHIARELAALDRAAALPLLEAMALADPHPEVRAAAARTRALLAV